MSIADVIAYFYCWLVGHDPYLPPDAPPWARPRCAQCGRRLNRG